MATEDMGRGLTQDDIMTARVQWLFKGGPRPPGLEDIKAAAQSWPEYWWAKLTNFFGLLV